MTMHAAIMGKIKIFIFLDFKFRQKQLKDYKSSDKHLFDTGIKVVKMKHNRGNDNKLFKKKISNKKLGNLTEFLFAEDKDDEEFVGYLPIEVDKNEIEKTYNLYI